MKYILSIFLATTFFITGNAQNEPTGFTVKGTFDSATEADSVVLLTYATNRIIARAPLVDGKFEIKGSVSEPQKVMLCYKTKDTEQGRERTSGDLFLENADYTVERKGENTKIKGGKLHDIALGFQSSDAYINGMNECNAAEDAAYANKENFYEPTPEEQKRMEEKAKIVLAIKKEATESVLANPKAPILAKVVALGESPDMAKYTLEKRIEMFDAYEKELGHPSLDLNFMRDAYKLMIEEKKIAQTLAPGKMYKEVVAKDADGKEIKLSEVVAKSKFTILEFWASWCGPCRGEIPNLKKAYEKYKSKGLEIYSVSIDEKSADWLKALEEENTKWIQVLDSKVAPKDYGVYGVPMSFLIGRDGKIVAISEHLRGHDLDRTLSKHFK